MLSEELPAFAVRDLVEQEQASSGLREQARVTCQQLSAAACCSPSGRDALELACATLRSRGSALPGLGVSLLKVSSGESVAKPLHTLRPLRSAGAVYQPCQASRCRVTSNSAWRQVLAVALLHACSMHSVPSVKVHLRRALVAAPLVCAGSWSLSHAARRVRRRRHGLHAESRRARARLEVAQWCSKLAVQAGTLSGALLFVSVTAAFLRHQCGDAVFLFQSLLALLSAEQRYTRLQVWQLQYPDAPRDQVESKWRSAHKAVAQELAPYLRDLHPSPPLAPALEVLEASSIAYVPWSDCVSITLAPHRIAAALTQRRHKESERTRADAQAPADADTAKRPDTAAKSSASHRPRAGATTPAAEDPLRATVPLPNAAEASGRCASAADEASCVQISDHTRHRQGSAAHGPSEVHTETGGDIAPLDFVPHFARSPRCLHVLHEGPVSTSAAVTQAREALAIAAESVRESRSDQFPYAHGAVPSSIHAEPSSVSCAAPTFTYNPLYTCTVPEGEPVATAPKPTASGRSSEASEPASLALRSDSEVNAPDCASESSPRNDTLTPRPAGAHRAAGNAQATTSKPSKLKPQPGPGSKGVTKDEYDVLQIVPHVHGACVVPADVLGHVPRRRPTTNEISPAESTSSNDAGEPAAPDHRDQPSAEPQGSLRPCDDAMAHVGNLADPAANFALLQQRTCERMAREQNLPLYGSNDHADPGTQEVVEASSVTPAVTTSDTFALLQRAALLIFLFTPFILLGVPLLLLSRRSSAPSEPDAVLVEREAVDADEADAGAAVPQPAEGPASVEAILAAEVGPSLVENNAPASADSGDPAEEGAPEGWRARCETTAWSMLALGCRNAGPAFIKWAQWAASRPDVFPTRLCRVLSQMHDDAPVHTWRHSRELITRAFGADPEHVFHYIEHEPLASGSIAQVHRAQLLGTDGTLHAVAVKVRHPGVVRSLALDFVLLKAAAGAAESAGLQALRNLRLKESVSQFSSTMTAQADLRVEAAHLERFVLSFHPLRDQVRIPTPWVHLVSDAVIVESFEEGASVARYIRAPSPLNTQIVARGVDVYIKMLLVDNFVHSDLHPGNILVHHRSADDLAVVLLDCGLAEELDAETRFKFISFLHALGRGDGTHAGNLLLTWSHDQRCPDPAAFVADMAALGRSAMNIHCEAGIDLDAVVKRVLLLAREHFVDVNSKYASLLLSVCVLVGFAKALDPALNLMDAAVPSLLTYSLTGRTVGRLYA